jgi:hypothetical protein
MDDLFPPLKVAQVTGKLSAPDDVVSELKLLPADSEGTYLGRFPVPEIGDYQLIVAIPDSDIVLTHNVG